MGPVLPGFVGYEAVPMLRRLQWRTEHAVSTVQPPFCVMHWLAVVLQCSQGGVIVRWFLCALLLSNMASICHIGVSSIAVYAAKQLRVGYATTSRRVARSCTSVIYCDITCSKSVTYIIVRNEGTEVNACRLGATVGVCVYASVSTTL